jgi:hypothetical protein
MAYASVYGEYGTIRGIGPQAEIWTGTSWRKAYPEEVAAYQQKQSGGAAAGGGGVVGTTISAPAATISAPATTGAAGPSKMPEDIYGMYKNLLMNPQQAMAQNPAYQFAREQGIEAATRKMAAAGMRTSGNIGAELAKLGAGYAGEQFQRFADVYNQGAGAEANRWGQQTSAQLGFGSQDIDRYRAATAGQIGLQGSELEARRQGLTWGGQLGGQLTQSPTAAAGAGAEYYSRFGTPNLPNMFPTSAPTPMTDRQLQDYLMMSGAGAR